MQKSELVTRYLRYCDDKNDDDFSGWEEVDKIVQKNSLDDGWEITTLLIDAAQSKKALANIAAGPLEDLLKRHGLKIVSKLKEEAQKKEKFRYALAGVWLSEDLEIYKEWLSLIEIYNLADMDPIDKSAWSEDNPIPS